MSDAEFEWFVGIDWASREHEVRVLDAQGRDCGRRVVEHSGPGLQELADWLVEQSGGRPEQVAVAIEVTRGPVVESLLARRIAVFGVNPKQLDRFRDGYSVAGAKDDRRDAYVLADTLRTSRDRYRRLKLGDPKIIALRALVESEEELASEERRLANRLRALLESYYPQALKLCPAADEPWLWSVLDDAPTPGEALHLKKGHLAKILHERRIRRLRASEVLRALREKSIHVAPGVAEAAGGQVVLLTARLRLAHTQRARCSRQLDAALAELEDDPDGDAAIVRSVPGAGRSVSAALLVDAADLLATRDYKGLRSYAGIAPITRQSGRSRLVLMRRACSARLREALYHWARCSVQRSAHFRAIYAAARGRGQSHGRALRGLADRLLRMLMAMLRSRTLYDPEKLTVPA
jgi:transposase